jgi:DNA repair exonuclease SbcCD ATPase subunit
MTGLIHAHKTLGAALAASIMLSGCMGTGPDGSSGGFSMAGVFGTGQKPALTPAEQRLREDANTFNETVLGGVAYNAAVGAALGALVGYLHSGGDLKQMLVYSSAGIAAGGVYGLIDGYRTANKQEAARRQVREVELITDKVRAENDQIEQSIKTAETVVSETRTKAAEVEQKLQNQEITTVQAESELQNHRDNIAELDKLIAGLQKRQDEYKQVADSIRQEGEDTSELDAQIAASSQRLAELQSEREVLAQSLEVTRIG